MEELKALWEVVPPCIQIPVLVLLAWVVIAKIIVGITSSGTELTEEESTRAFGIVVAPVVVGWMVLWSVAKGLNRMMKFYKYPGAVDNDDDVPLL